MWCGRILEIGALDEVKSEREKEPSAGDQLAVAPASIPVVELEMQSN